MQPLKTVTSPYMNNLCKGRFVLMIPNFRVSNVRCSVSGGSVNREAINMIFVFIQLLSDR